MADLITMLQAAAGAAVQPSGYQISRSLRFNSADSAYLSRTPASAGDRKTWTWSGWVKLSAIGSSDLMLFTSRDVGSTYYGQIQIGAGGNSILQVTSVSFTLATTQLFRDLSAWYHIVVAVDTTQATEANRVKIYVNGSQVTAFGTATYPAEDANTDFNQAVQHSIGSLQPQNGNYFNGYLTEINFIDGQTLTPSSFGETNATTGVWSPIAYAGSYGTNGFYLNFSDNTSTTTLGEDQAGSNNWTLNNFSVTAGAGNDSLVDVPTLWNVDTGAGGEVRGNYATWNPLNTGNTLTLSNGNLYAGRTNVNNSQYYTAASTFAVNSGKWYWEVYADFVISSPGQWSQLGIVTSTISNFSNAAIGYSGALSSAYAYYNDGTKAGNGAATAGYGATFATGDTIGVAFDADNGTITFYKNGVSQGQAFSGISMTNAWSPVFQLYDGSPGTVHGFFLNAGQRPFAYTAPSGFKALVTTNLPDPTVVQGDDYFNTVLYTGTGSSLGVTGVGFQPDWVWIKERNAAADHGLYDAVRGVTKQLESNTDTAETTEATGLTAFGSDGFTVGALAQLNTSADTYVAWNWKANGAGVSNTAGTISSTVSVSTTSGFSIVTYTGTGSAATIGHGLGAVPRMIIVKNRDAADAWQVYQAANTANPETDYLVLNTTAATADALDRWNDTAPTSSVFSLGDGVEVNTNTEDYVAYCFAEVEGFSKFGSYTGNGSADGPFIYTGFRPAWVMIKQSSASGEHWVILDNQRNLFNVQNRELYANLTNVEGANGGNATLDFLSNGFKIRTTNAGQNTSSATYVYACFASNPFKTSLAR